jgi:hypothetical protein
MNRKLIISIVLCLAIPVLGLARKPDGEMPVRHYYRMLDSLRTGWNTWDTRSMFTQLYLPEAFSVKVALVDGDGIVADDLRAGNPRKDAAYVHPYDHVIDNSYSEVDATWHGVSVKLRSTSEGDRLIMLLTPKNDNSASSGKLRIKAEYAWPNFNHITGRDRYSHDEVSSFHFETYDKHVKMDGGIIGEGLSYDDGCYYCDAGSPVLIYTGKPLTVNEADNILKEKKLLFDGMCDQYGSNRELYRAIHSILSWDTIYDPGDNVVVTPVSRNWNLRWSMVPDYGGFVLFDWDTYFASFMFSKVSRELAYSNVVELTKSIDECGFVPKSRSDHDNLTSDCSQPPVGSMAVWNIYKRFGEKWLLELLYPRLLTWNKWWPEARQTDGLLCWGSNLVRIRLGERGSGSTNHAILESGLDNSSMYDEAKINPQTGQLNLQDVGLTSMYVMDCEYLALIAKELGHKKDARELEARASFFRKNIQRFWCEEDGMFYNINTDTGEFNRHTSATNFYVLLADAATKTQARRIVEEHLLNENEFWGEWVIPMSPKNDPAYKDQNYWRGRIWGPTNFLVYLGLRNYPDDTVRKALIDKSVKLMLKGWDAHGYIYENWNAITGEGGDRSNCDTFYHWGALMAFMALLEE